MTGSHDMSETAEAVLHYLRDQRWFAGKGGHSTLAGIEALPWLANDGDEPRVRVLLLTVETDGRDQLYSLPLAYYP